MPTTPTALVLRVATRLSQQRDLGVVVPELLSDGVPATKLLPALGMVGQERELEAVRGLAVLDRPRLPAPAKSGITERCVDSRPGRGGAALRPHWATALGMSWAKSSAMYFGAAWSSVEAPARRRRRCTRTA